MSPSLARGAQAVNGRTLCHDHAMHLEHIAVVNFRGITELRLDLESDTTVCFGENAWGKTTLVEALQSALGDRSITEADFHRLENDRHSIARHLGISLRFGGEPPRDWESAGWRDGRGAFHLVLHWAGHRLSRGRIRVDRVFLGPDGRELPLPEGDAALLADLVIKAHPLHVFHELRLAEGMLAPALAPELELHEAPDRAVRRIFERLLTVPHQVHPGELARGLEALQHLATLRPDLFQPGNPGFRRASDMADAPMLLQDGRSLGDLARRAGAGTRQVALLALVGAMLQAEMAWPKTAGVSPLLVLEDPETHLHPIQLATVWSLMEQLPVQKLVTTATGSLLAAMPSRALRRLVRRPRQTAVFPHPEARPLNPIDARRVAFHVRTHHAESLFARVWLLVEGETEAWLLPELARVQGLSFPLEGIHCVAFAQAGLAPLVAFADRFGIPWHVIADGDEAGQHYAAKVRHLLKGRPESRHLTLLPDQDMEHFLWRSGFAPVYRRAANQPPPPDPGTTIHQALKAHSKPGMALEVAEEAGRRGPDTVPALLRKCYATLMKLGERR
nr:DUF2813 domain-containing protein [uncultured Holophaga sp.]